MVVRWVEEGRLFRLLIYCFVVSVCAVRKLRCCGLQLVEKYWFVGDDEEDEAQE